MHLQNQLMFSKTTKNIWKTKDKKKILGTKVCYFLINCVFYYSYFQTFVSVYATYNNNKLTLA